jgi:separase
MGKLSKVGRWIKALGKHDVVLYCGHGSAEDLAKRERVQTLERCAKVILMGCSSGKTVGKGAFEPQGAIHAFVLAKSPCVVANLWDVTDKDIDRFTMRLLDLSFPSKASRSDSGGAEARRGDCRVSLVEATSAARTACKLPYLVGAAPVCFGVPEWTG